MLERAGGRHRIGRAVEGGKEAVAFAAALHQRPAVPLDHRRRQGVVTSQGVSHRLGVLLPEAGVALDIGQEERDRARW